MKRIILSFGLLSILSIVGSKEVQAKSSNVEYETITSVAPLENSLDNHSTSPASSGNVSYYYRNVIVSNFTGIPPRLIPQYMVYRTPLGALVEGWVYPIDAYKWRGQNVWAYHGTLTRRTNNNPIPLIVNPLEK